MEGLKVYQVCVDNGKTCSKQFVTAYDEREAKDRIYGAGEVIAVRWIEGYQLDTAEISNVLLHSNLNENTVNVIMDVLAQSGLAW